MKRLLLPAAVVIILALLFVGAWQYLKNDPSENRLSSLDEMEEVGVPQFVLPNLAGENVPLADIEGEILIVNFWASWCGPCVEEFPSMMELVKRYDGQVKLVAISEDSSRDDMEAFLKAFSGHEAEEVIVLWDENREVAASYNVDKLPETFLVGPDRKLIRKVAGTMNWMEPSVVAYIDSLIVADTPSQIAPPAAEAAPAGE